MLLSAAEVFLQIVIFCGSHPRFPKEKEFVFCVAAVGVVQCLEPATEQQKWLKPPKKKVASCPHCDLRSCRVSSCMVSCYPVILPVLWKMSGMIAVKGSVEDRILDDDLSGIFRMCPVFLSIFPAICNPMALVPRCILYTSPLPRQGKGSSWATANGTLVASQRWKMAISLVKKHPKRYVEKDQQ